MTGAEAAHRGAFLACSAPTARCAATDGVRARTQADRGDETFSRFCRWFHPAAAAVLPRLGAGPADGQPGPSKRRPLALTWRRARQRRPRMATPRRRARPCAAGLRRPAVAPGAQRRWAGGVVVGFSGHAGDVEQFVGAGWRCRSRTFAHRRRGCAAPAGHRALGASAVLGRTVFDRQHHFRIHIGGLSLSAFESLLRWAARCRRCRRWSTSTWVLNSAGTCGCSCCRAGVPDQARPARAAGWRTWLGAPRMAPHRR